jgi:hypothetical protein
MRRGEGHGSEEQPPSRAEYDQTFVPIDTE